MTAHFKTVKPLTFTLPFWAVDKLRAVCAETGRSVSGQILYWIVQATESPPPRTLPPAKGKAEKSRRPQ